MSYKTAKLPELKVFKFMEPEEADGLIKQHLAKLPSKGGKCGSLNVRWEGPILQLRRSIILDLISQGLSNRRVSEELQSRWEISDPTAKNYLKDAISYICTEDENLVENYRAINTQRLEGIIEDALAHNDRKSALGALDQLNKMYAQYTQKVDAKVEGEQTITFEFS